MQISVCDNPIVRANTNLQLPLINNATLRAWFKTRVTCLERQQLTKYLQMPVPAAPSMPIPLARQQPATLDEGQEDIRHEFKLPQNTAGTGKARRKCAAVKIQAAVLIAPLHVHSHVVRAFCPARLSSHTVYAASANSVNDRASCSTDQHHHSHQQQARPPCLLLLPHSPRLCTGKWPGLRHGVLNPMSLC
ncbi:hypothetical protein ACOMHN_049186 [Nucella lapillus]